MNIMLKNLNNIHPESWYEAGQTTQILHTKDNREKWNFRMYQPTGFPLPLLLANYTLSGINTYYQIQAAML